MRLRFNLPIYLRAHLLIIKLCRLKIYCLVLLVFEHQKTRLSMPPTGSAQGRSPLPIRQSLKPYPCCRTSLCSVLLLISTTYTQHNACPQILLTAFSLQSCGFPVLCFMNNVQGVCPYLSSGEFYQLLVWVDIQKWKRFVTQHTD